jgi:predicted dehydrogenase
MQMQVKAAVVGMGSMGKIHAYSYAYMIKNTMLTAICDLDKSTFEEYKCNKCNKYTDYKELINKEKIDILSVVTTADSHAEVVIYAAENGIKKIFCEKPIATSLNDAKKMIDTCRNNNVVLQINHSRRWHYGFSIIKALLKENKIGNVVHIHSTLGGGRFGCMGTHIFDVWRLLLDSDCAQLIGVIDKRYTGDHKGRKNINDPGGYALIKFQNNVRATIDISEDLGTPVHHVITGNYGRIIFDEGRNTISIYARSDEDKNKRLGCYDLPLLSEEIELTPNLSDTTALLCAAIIELLHKDNVSCTGLDGYKSLEMCIAIHLSDAQGNKQILFPYEKWFGDYRINIT